jgi:hypothetical protein
MHLFFECPASVIRWFIVNIQWNVQGSLHHMLIQ